MTEEQVFLAALDLPSEGDRSAYLDTVCGTDTELRRQVEELLAAHFKSGDFLNEPVGQQLAAGSATPAIAETLYVPGGSEKEAMPSEQKPTEEPDDLHFLLPATRPDSLGRIGHYEVLQVLGKGGFGVVFRAFDDVLQRVVALKVLAPAIAATSPARKRFLREAQASARVRHENVVQVHAVEELPTPYLVMEFIAGETLQQRLDRKGPLQTAEIVSLGRQIAEGLAAAHATGLIHRDIKPGNILIEGSSRDRVKITDFGLARAADDASMTQSGVVAGTPMFMAPEQAQGDTLDQRADLFSLGSVLYVMASGRPPFRAATTFAVLKRVVEEAPRPITDVIPETPQWLCDIITKLHAKSPDDRYQSAREVADVLANCESQLKEHSKVRDLSLIPRAKTQPAGWRKWAAVAAVLLFPVIALAVTEFAGVTHLFRGQQATNDPIKPGSEPAPNQVTRQDASASDGWAQLFNGKDLSGWKTRPEAPGHWEVKDGILMGSRLPSVLYSERGDYANFHLRVETKVNLGGDSGVFFRVGFGTPMTIEAWQAAPDGGFEVEILKTKYARKTGSVTALKNGPPVVLGLTSDDSLTQPDEWFTLEIIAEQDRFITKVNGKETANCRDPLNKLSSGHVGLQVWSPKTIVQFRKIEIKELPPVSAAKPETLPPTFTNSIGMEFVIVPKGKSWLGGGKDKLGDKEVEIPADFYLGKYEVTQEEWTQVMGENPSHFSRTGDGKDAVKDIPDADLKRFPVENVSWDQCQVFVAKLNQREKEAGWVYRMPTEAEWEYACRGGPIGDRADSAFDFYFAKPTNTLSPDDSNSKREAGLNRPCQVGSYKSNRLGIFDMHGNVWELCDDIGIQSSVSPGRVLRGGAFGTDPSWSSATLGRRVHPVPAQYDHIGLRLARVPSGAPSPEVKTPPLAVALFTDADVKRIAALPAAEQVEEVRKELMRRNRDFDGTLTPTIQGEVVTGLEFNTDCVSDISPVRALTGLGELKCDGTRPRKGQLADLSPLKDMKLTTLSCMDTQVANLSPLKGLKLTQLYFSYTLVSDLSPLRDMKLTRMQFTSTKVTNLEPLQEMRLQRLTFNSTNVSDLSPLQNMNLQLLHCSDTPVSDLSPLKGMAMENLWCNRTKVTDISILSGMPLNGLNFDFQPKRDAEILRSLKTLLEINGKPAAEFWEEVEPK